MMDKNKVIEILENIEIKSNKDLNNCLSELGNEFKKTKELIISLTYHIDSIIENYDKINNEIGKRHGK